ncbi:uncharacterized protein LOC125947504 [Dermacentor silvarum]|uniref:uncharacterized protein LOC125947504 n=1 Tax=Dermacentor silvarum TaxID=543639 RepID=UPI0021009613|nr:uncharacterized protein LOC125947504 [Dermacentor silvarum]
MSVPLTHVLLLVQVVCSSRALSTGHEWDSHGIIVNITEVFACNSEEIFKALNHGPVTPTTVESGICPATVNEPWFTATITSLQKAVVCSSRALSTGHEWDSHGIIVNITEVFACNSEEIFKALNHGPVMPTTVESGICPATVNEPWFTATITSLQKAVVCSSRALSTGHEWDSHGIIVNITEVFACNSEEIFKALNHGPVTPTTVESGICPATVNEPWFTATITSLQKAVDCTVSLGRGTGSAMSVPLTHVLLLVQVHDILYIDGIKYIYDDPSDKVVPCK